MSDIRGAYDKLELLELDDTKSIYRGPIVRHMHAERFKGRGTRQGGSTGIRSDGSPLDDHSLAWCVHTMLAHGKALQRVR